MTEREREGNVFEKMKIEKELDREKRKKMNFEIKIRKRVKEEQ